MSHNRAGRSGVDDPAAPPGANGELEPDSTRAWTLYAVAAALAVTFVWSVIAVRGSLTSHWYLLAASVAAWFLFRDRVQRPSAATRWQRTLVNSLPAEAGFYALLSVLALWGAERLEWYRPITCGILFVTFRRAADAARNTEAAFSTLYSPESLEVVKKAGWSVMKAGWDDAQALVTKIAEDLSPGITARHPLTLTRLRSPAEWALFGVSGVAVAGFVVLVFRHAALGLDPWYLFPVALALIPLTFWLTRRFHFRAEIRRRARTLAANAVRQFRAEGRAEAFAQECGCLPSELERVLAQRYEGLLRGNLLPTGGPAGDPAPKV
jgi:hypothetical protein